MSGKRVVYTVFALMATVGIALTGCDWQGGGDETTAAAGSLDAKTILGAVPAALANLEPMDPAVPVPDVVFKAGDGREVTLKDPMFANKVLVVNLWATWCAPCVREMPALNALQEKLGGDGFQVVAVSNDRRGASIAGPFLRNKGFTALDLFVDKDGEIGRALGSQGLPTTYLVDKRGMVLGSMLGIAEWDAPEAVAFLKRIMATE